MSESRHDESCPAEVSDSAGAPSTSSVVLALAAAVTVLVLVLGTGLYCIAWAWNGYQREQARIEAEEQARQEQLLEVRRKKHQEQIAAAERQMREERESHLERQREALERAQAAELAREQDRLARQDEQRRKRELQQAMAAQVRMRDNMSRVHGALASELAKRRQNLVVPLGVDQHLAPGLSWRVHLLPKIGQTALYDEFRLNEPWDSDHNKALIARMPTIYGASDGNGQTRVRCSLRIDGERANRLHVHDVSDGFEQTALLFYVGAEDATTWTRPDALDDPTTFLRDLPDSHGRISFTLCSSGRVAYRELDPAVLRAILTPNGGEHFDIQALTRGHDVQLVGGAAEAPAGMPDPAHDTAAARDKLPLIIDALNRFREDLKDKEFARSVISRGLSWRVYLLPYLGEQDLFEEFDLQSGWASETNLKLITRMPDVFRLGTTPGRTRFMLRQSRNDRYTPLGVPEPSALRDLPGLTALVYFSAPHLSVAWTRPESGVRRLSKPQDLWQSLGWRDSDPVIAGMADGAVIEVPPGLHVSKLAALQSLNGRETFDLAECLAEPGTPLKLRPIVAAAKKIEKIVALPSVPPGAEDSEAPAGSLTDEQVRKIYRAIFRFQEANRRPPTEVKRRDGSPSQLSWRVHLLPYLEQRPLYDKFARDEPWDSETNKPLLELMPDIFSSFAADTSETSVQVLTGSASMMVTKHFFRPVDGLDNTILFLRTGAAHRVPWTKPDDTPAGPELKMSDLVSEDEELGVVTATGRHFRLPPDTPDEVVAALATRSGWEFLDGDTVARWAAHRRGDSYPAAAEAEQWEEKRLKKIMVAFHNFHDVYNAFPPSQYRRDRRSRLKDAVTDVIPLRSTQLSWRVHLLPFIGQAALYEQFRVEEPWDSPHNLQLLSTMPDCYRSRTDPADSTETRLMLFTGKQTLYEVTGVSVRIADVTDGTAQTIAVFEAPADAAVPWTKPVDYEVDLENLDTLRRLTDPGILLSMFDGRVLRLPPNSRPADLKALITPQGREIIQSRTVFGE